MPAKAALKRFFDNSFSYPEVFNDQARDIVKGYLVLIDIMNNIIIIQKLKFTSIYKDINNAQKRNMLKLFF